MLFQDDLFFFFFISHIVVCECIYKFTSRIL
jgi:hypothetical protein